jgi:hypothetical protein
VGRRHVLRRRRRRELSGFVLDCEGKHNVTPSEGLNWTVVAAQGVKGDKGIPGTPARRPEGQRRRDGFARRHGAAGFPGPAGSSGRGPQPDADRAAALVPGQ